MSSYGANGDARYTVFAVNFRHGVTKLQRDAEVIETLDDIALEAAGVRLELCDDVYLRAL